MAQATVSKIKKEKEAWTSSLAYFKAESLRVERLFRIAFIGGLLKTARIEFKTDGVLIRNSSEDKPIVYAIFPQHYFQEYRIAQPFDGYVELDIMKVLSTSDFVEVALTKENAWRIRMGSRKISHEYEGLNWRDFPLPNLEIDGDGIPTTVQFKAEIYPKVFPQKEKGRIILDVADQRLKGSFKCRYGWTCEQEMKIDRLVKDGDARAVVELETLDKVLKILDGPVWIGMWSDRQNLAIGMGNSDSIVCIIL